MSDIPGKKTLRNGPELAGSRMLSLVNEAIENFIKEYAGSANAKENSGRGTRDKKELDTSKLKRDVIARVLEDSQLGKALSQSMDLAESLLEHHKDAYINMGYQVCAVDFVLTSPGLVGSSTGVFSTIFEVGMELDPLLGLPYYPASTIKGAVRSMCESIIDVGKAGENICDELFGTSKDKGHVSNIVFSPAYPIGCLSSYGPCTVYWGDVVNPHYYRSGEPVESELDVTPKPLLHLSIAPGTVFRVIIAMRSTYKYKSFTNVERFKEVICEKEGECKGIRRLLAEALSSHPLYFVAVLMAASLKLGFAARSGKGYNVARILRDGEAGELSRDVVRLVLSFPQSSKSGKEGAQRYMNKKSQPLKKSGG